MSVSSNHRNITMSYVYSKPEYLYQSIHNYMAKVILQTGRFVGYFWIDNHNSPLEFSNGSKYLWIWSIFIPIFIILSQIYMSIHFQLLFYESGYSILSSILGGMTQSSYIALLVANYSTALIKRKNIIELCNTGISLNRFKTTRSDFKTYHCYRKMFAYKLFFKFFVDFYIIFASILLMITRFSYECSISTFLFLVSFPISLISYCFINTIYYVTFAYAAFLIQELRAELNYFPNSNHISFVSHFYERILKYSKKVNKMLQVSLLLLLAEAFIGLVDQVD